MPTEKFKSEQYAQLQGVLNEDVQHCIRRYEFAESSVREAVMESRKSLGAAAKNYCEADYDKAVIDFDNAAASMQRATKIASNPFHAERGLLDAETNAFRALGAWMRTRAAAGTDPDRMQGYAEEARELTLAALSERDARNSNVVGWAKVLAEAWADRPSARDETRAPLIHDSLQRLGVVSRMERIRVYLKSMPMPRSAAPLPSGREARAR